MLFIQKVIKEILIVFVSGILTFQGTGDSTPISNSNIILEEAANEESVLYDPISTIHEKPLEVVIEEAQEELDEQKEAEEERLRQEQEAQAFAEVQAQQEQETVVQETQKETPQTQAQSTPQTQASTPTPAPQPTPKPAQEAPKQSLSQYVSLNGTQYPFKELALDTQVAQNFIDTNPGSYGLWQDVTYATTFDILFAHYYAAGKLVYDSSVGSTITMKFASGETRTYQVVSKTIQSVNSYYDSNSNLWKTVGTNFDLMIKTCYDVGVTDIIITLVQT